MLFAVRFQDDPSLADIRRENLGLHIEWLDKNSDSVLVGGSLRREPNDNPIGGLWVVDAESKEAVQSLIESDPFWKKGLRIDVEILHWSKAFEERKVLV